MSVSQQIPEAPVLSSKTFGNQHLLPRVPLPDLEGTCTRFIEWCAPLLTDDELAETKAKLDNFARPGGPGQKLHADLLAYDQKPGVKSWLDDFWPTRYLGRRDRIALNANFFFQFTRPGNDQISRAAELLTAALNYKLRLDREEIPPALARGNPLDMNQNKFLFSTTRIPGVPLDTVRAPYSEAEPGPSKARHILVLHNRAIYRMDVIGANGRPHTIADFEKTLSAIKAASTTPVENNEAVGHFTTMARADWADTRQELFAIDPVNEQRMDEIETALFCICLEDMVPGNKQEAADQLLHGDSGNRWFEKAVSLVVFGDGSSGINIEHCGLDGTTVLAFVDALHAEDAAAAALTLDATEQGIASHRRIDFILTDALKQKLESAAKSFADYAAAMATQSYTFQNFGANRSKELGLSPDAFAQLAYQLAHKRAKGFNGATYESIATRGYDHGRTEAMRVITPEIFTFVEDFDDPAKSAEEKIESLRAAAARHVGRAKECQIGHAPEQHLWELQMIQTRRGAALGVEEELEFFNSPGWLISRNDYLSTSSCPSINVDYFGFGCTSAQCIGIGYVLMPDHINIYFSTPTSVAPEMHKFADELTRALTEMEQLLASTA